MLIFRRVQDRNQSQGVLKFDPWPTNPVWLVVFHQPIWKICASQKWESSPNRGENIKKLKPQPSCLFFRGVQFILNLFGNPLLLPFSRRPAPVSKAPLANKNAKSQEKLFFHHPEPSPMLTNLKKKRVWRAFQHLPFQDPCHLSKSIFSCHLAFFNKLHQMFDFKGRFFVCNCIVDI